jgi:synaptobrevin family protein YKT6
MDQFLSEVPLATIKAATKDGDVSFPALQDYLNNYQDANQASSISRIQQELDETKIILHKAIDSVCSVSPDFRSLLPWSGHCADT